MCREQFLKRLKKNTKNPDRIQNRITLRYTQRSQVVVERSAYRSILTSLKIEVAVYAEEDIYLNKVHGVTSQNTLNLIMWGAQISCDRIPSTSPTQHSCEKNARRSRMETITRMDQVEP